MIKPEKDEFIVGLQKELSDLGIKSQYKRMLFYDSPSQGGKGEYYVHQIMVTGLVCRAMYITFVPGGEGAQSELHVSDRLYFKKSTKDWELVLADPKSNPQLVIDFFRDLKAVGDKYKSQTV